MTGAPYVKHHFDGRGNISHSVCIRKDQLKAPQAEGRVLKFSSGNLIGFFTLFNGLKDWSFSCRFFPNEALIFFQTTFAFTIQEDRIIRGYVYSTFEIILLTGVERNFPGSPERRFWGGPQEWSLSRSLVFRRVEASESATSFLKIVIDLYSIHRGSATPEIRNLRLRMEKTSPLG